MLETARWVPSNANVRALQAAQPRAPNSAADEPASRDTFEQRIHTIPNSSLAPRRCTRLLPIHTHGRPLAHARASPMTQAHAHYRSSTLTLKLRHFSARREASTLYIFQTFETFETFLIFNKLNLNNLLYTFQKASEIPCRCLPPRATTSCDGQATLWEAGA